MHCGSREVEMPLMIGRHPATHQRGSVAIKMLDECLSIRGILKEGAEFDRSKLEVADYIGNAQFPTRKY